MTMIDAVRSVLTQYATFTGRARRSEYWWFTLAYVIVSVVVSIIDVVIGTDDVFADTGLLSAVLSLALLLPGLAVGVRRLHDTGRRGWWLLLAFVPLVGAIILIVWFCGDSKPDNQYGPNPKFLSAPRPYGA